MTPTYEIIQKASPKLIDNLFVWLRANDKPLYKSVVVSLTQDRKLRPVYVEKKPLPEQFAWLKKTLSLKSSDMMGEHLLQIWFMKGNQDLLVAFCDSMGIEHDGSGAVDGELPESLDADKLKQSVDVLTEKFDAELVSVYLHVFNLQNEGGWPALTDLLEKDDRLALS